MPMTMKKRNETMLLNIEFEDALRDIKKTVEDIRMLAIVTETRSEVVFYGKKDGIIKQSNNMAEEGILDPYKLDLFYREIAEHIRNSQQFKKDCLNIVKYDTNEGIRFEYAKSTESSVTIMKNWKKQIGINKA